MLITQNVAEMHQTQLKFESLRYNNDREHKQVHMPAIDEVDDSVISEGRSIEEMLNCVPDNELNKNKESSWISTVNSNDFSWQQKILTYVTEANFDVLLYMALLMKEG